MKKSMILALLMTSLSATTWAAETTSKSGETKKPNAPTAEQRQKMAAVHEKMAACLKSDKPISECRDEMKKVCHDMMGKDGCPMGGGMGHGHGHGHDHDEDQGHDEGKE